MVKLTSGFFAPYLLNAININIRQSTFPENAKVVSVVLLDKGKSNKKHISIFWPVDILSTSSKIYELVVEDQITSEIDKYSYALVSTYKKSYNTQHIIMGGAVGVAEYRRISQFACSRTQIFIIQCRKSHCPSSQINFILPQKKENKVSLTSFQA